MLARAFILCLGLAVSLVGLRAEAKTRATLLLDHANAKRGETIVAGVRLKMPPGWHTYWKNPGESGKETRIKWNLPQGLKAGEIRWPLPEKTIVLDQVVYVYEDEAVLLIPLDISPMAAQGKLELKATVSWLECEKLCIPGSAEVSATLDIGGVSTLSPDATLLETATKRLPGGNAVAVQAKWNKGTDNKSQIVELRFKPTKTGKWDFFPNPLDNIEFAGESKSGAAGDLLKVARKFEGEWPDSISGVLALISPEGKTLEGFEFTASTGTSLVTAAGTAGSTSGKESSASAEVGPGFVSMLLYAFIGGLILNIMPCVLPVIALKILGFVNQSRKHPGRVRFLGLMYGAGVLASFMVLAGIVIAIRVAGGNAAWGQQYQNPLFIVGMTALVLLVALNLFGVFEVQASGKAMDAAYSASSKSGAGGAFFNGVFATMLATPCTAPFLGVSLGFAFTRPPSTILLFFLAAGTGLALPYVLLCWQPAWLKFLPKPGDWMVKFKTIMGFPMLGTAIWLYSLAFSHYGKDKMLPLGLFLVALALGAWIFGEFVQKRSERSWSGILGTLGCLALAYVFLLEREVDWRHPVTTETTALQTNKFGMVWEAWSEEAVKKAQREGRPILVDFTADWCTTCQYNKRTAIEVAAVAARLKQLNAVTLMGDFTREDPAIRAELKKFKRAGVPLVLVYPAAADKKPKVLPEFLTKQTVLDNLATVLD